jgi:hypothetical protein
MAAFRCFLGSKFALVAMFAIALIGAYLVWNHTGDVWLAAPYVLLLSCPFMHLFGHRHSHRQDQHSGQN